MIPSSEKYHTSDLHLTGGPKTGHRYFVFDLETCTATMYVFRFRVNYTVIDQLTTEYWLTINGLVTEDSDFTYKIFVAGKEYLIHLDVNGNP